MRARVKLRLDGSAVVCTIPRPILIYLGWLPGEEVIIELTEKQTLHIRPFTAEDIPPRGAPRLMYDFIKAEAK